MAKFGPSIGLIQINSVYIQVITRIHLNSFEKNPNVPKTMRF